MNKKVIAALVAIGVYLIILAQNTEIVTVKLLFWEASMSRIILMTITGMIGFIIGYLFARFSGGRHGEASASIHKAE
ncbi:MAG: LapA family protein [Desulfomonile tiedjei]|nr:LapA family protein [Desulfomonile tiedjei]